MASWKIIDTSSPRICRNASSPSPTISRPLSRMLPVTAALAGNRPITALASVLLPLPLSPTMPKISPGSSASETEVDSRRRLDRISASEADADVGEGEDRAHSATPSRVENRGAAPRRGK